MDERPAFFDQLCGVDPGHRIPACSFSSVISSVHCSKPGTASRRQGACCRQHNPMTQLSTATRIGQSLRRNRSSRNSPRKRKKESIHNHQRRSSHLIWAYIDKQLGINSTLCLPPLPTIHAFCEPPVLGEQLGPLFFQVLSGEDTSPNLAHKQQRKFPVVDNKTESSLPVYDTAQDNSDKIDENVSILSLQEKNIFALQRSKSGPYDCISCFCQPNRSLSNLIFLELPQHTPAPCIACAYICHIFTNYDRLPCDQHLQPEFYTKRVLEREKQAHIILISDQESYSENCESDTNRRRCKSSTSFHATESDPIFSTTSSLSSSSIQQSDLIESISTESRESSSTSSSGSTDTQHTCLQSLQKNQSKCNPDLSIDEDTGNKWQHSEKQVKNQQKGPRHTISARREATQKPNHSFSETINVTRKQEAHGLLVKDTTQHQALSQLERKTRAELFKDSVYNPDLSSIGLQHLSLQPVSKQILKSKKLPAGPDLAVGSREEIVHQDKTLLHKEQVNVSFSQQPSEKLAVSQVVPDVAPDMMSRDDLYSNVSQRKAVLRFSYRDEMSMNRGWIVGDQQAFNPKRQTMQEWASGRVQMRLCRRRHGTAHSLVSDHAHGFNGSCPGSEAIVAANNFQNKCVITEEHAGTAASRSPMLPSLPKSSQSITSSITDSKFTSDKLKYSDICREEFYLRGGCFLSMLNGTGAAYYPSGRLAICTSSCLNGMYIWAFDDSEGGQLLAALSPFGGGTYYRAGHTSPVVVTSVDGGYVFDLQGNTVKEWKWGHPMSYVYSLNSSLTLRITTKHDTTLTLRCQDYPPLRPHYIKHESHNQTSLPTITMTSEEFGEQEITSEVSNLPSQQNLLAEHELILPRGKKKKRTQSHNPSPNRSAIYTNILSDCEKHETKRSGSRFSSRPRGSSNLQLEKSHAISRSSSPCSDPHANDHDIDSRIQTILHSMQHCVEELSNQKNAVTFTTAQADILQAEPSNSLRRNHSYNSLRSTRSLSSVIAHGSSFQLETSPSHEISKSISYHTQGKGISHKVLTVQAGCRLPKSKAIRIAPISYSSELQRLRTKADILLAYISTCLQHLKELNRIEIRQSSRGISYAISCMNTKLHESHSRSNDPNEVVVSSLSKAISDVPFPHSPLKKIYASDYSVIPSSDHLKNNNIALQETSSSPPSRVGVSKSRSRPFSRHFPGIVCPTVLSAQHKSQIKNKLMLPDLNDSILDEFLAAIPQNHAVVIGVLGPENDAESFSLKNLLSQLYREQVGFNRYPCQFTSSDVNRYFKYSLARGKSRLLEQRHGVTSGLVLIFLQQRLAFVNRTVSGRPITEVRLLQEIRNCRENAQKQCFLPRTLWASGI